MMVKSSNQFVQKVTEHKLSTWFLLPLIELSKFSFGPANFNECYVNRQGTVLIVELLDLKLCPSFAMHPEYLKEQSTEQFDYIYFALPGNWKEDFELFTKGQFSKFSEDAKAMIRNYSGLRYKGDAFGTVKTDARILALEKDPALRQRWEEELKLLPLPDSMELLSIPDDSTYRQYDE